MSLSMPTTRKIFRKQDEVQAKLRKEIRAAGITGIRKQRQAIQAAASGRPNNLRELAIESIRQRRVQRDLDMIAGRS